MKRLPNTSASFNKANVKDKNEIKAFLSNVDQPGNFGGILNPVTPVNHFAIKIVLSEDILLRSKY